MRQKPLHWLLSRAFSGTKELSRARFSNAFAAEHDASPALNPSAISAVRRWISGFPATVPTKDPLKVLSEKATSRTYAAPGSANPSPKTDRSKMEGIKGGTERKINRAIVARMIRLVHDDGHEILSRYEALQRAQFANLDLVEVDGRADPPVCKLMDFNKERFKVKKQEKDLRKKQLERRRLDDLKEVRFSSRTEQKDLEMKVESVSRLLERGHKVKLVVQFHGNDKGEDVGEQLLERAMSLIHTEVKIENGPRVEKMRAWVMMRPILEQKDSKKKAAKVVPVEVADEMKAVEG